MRSGRAVRDLYRHDMKLLLRILVAIALGIGAGFVFPGWLASVFATFNAVFSSLLNFVIPLLIVGFVAPAIADIGRRAGAMLGVTVAIAYLMTFGSGMLAYFTASLTFPSLIGDTVVPAADTAGTAPVPYFQIPIEPLMSVTSSLVLAFVLGFGCAVLGQSAARLKGVIDDFRSVINLIIAKVIVPLLPIYIFGIFMSMTIEGAVGPVLMTFVRIIAVIFVLHVLVLVLQYLGRRPSSAATIRLSRCGLCYPPMSRPWARSRRPRQSLSRSSAPWPWVSVAILPVSSFRSVPRYTCRVRHSRLCRAPWP